MPVFIIDKLKPKNNGSFKLMDTLDINHKGYDLEDFLDNLNSKLTEIIESLPANTKLLEMEVIDNWICWKYVTEDETQWRQLLDISNIVNGGVNEVYVGNQEPTDPNIKIWIDTTESSDTEEDFIKIPTKLSELEDNMGFITLDDLKENLKILKSGSSILIKYGDTTISSTEV